MRTAYLCLCLLLSGSILAQDGPVKSAKTKSQVPAANSSVPLPVSKVVLYKNGIGYFEHKGKVRGDQQFGIESLLVSYISEVPVWKSTYRIVIPKAPGRPFLQGWAIVDNTVGEDWKDVKLSLVSGTPQSFVQNISQPYYTRRPVVPLPESVMLTPQAHEASMTNLGASAMTLPGVAGGVPGGVAGGSMGGVLGGVIGGSGSGGGIGGGNLDAGKVLSLSKPTEQEEAAEVTEALSKEEAAAEANAVGELFEYNLKEKITVLKTSPRWFPSCSRQLKWNESHWLLLTKTTPWRSRCVPYGFATPLA